MPQITEGSRSEKAVPPASAAEQAPTVKVTFARDFTLSAGPYEDSSPERSFKNGETTEIPADRAGEVLTHGYARPHDARLAQVYRFPPPEENKEG